jgi:hypothetical protein
LGKVKRKTGKGLKRKTSKTKSRSRR